MDLKRDIEHGVFYNAIAKYAGVFITLAVTAVLSRVFTPEQFGIVNIATVFITFFNILGDMGIAPAIIQNRDLDEDDLRSIFSLSLWIAAIMAVVFIIAAFPISYFYKDTGFLRKILLILSSCIFFKTISMVPNALLYKDKKFRFVAVRTLIIQLLSGLLAIAAAVSGMGIYALTINPVMSSILLFIISYSQYPILPRLFPARESVRKVLKFSLFQFGFQLVNYFNNNVDKLLLGKMNVGELGYYDKSYRLIGLPSQYITYVISPVLHPVMAQIQDDKKHIASSYMQIVKMLAYVGVIISVGMFFMSDNLIYLFFGYQWTRSILCTKILSLTIFLNLIASSSGPIFQAANDTRRLFICGVFSACCMIACVSVGVFVFRNTEGLAACVAAATAINFLQCYNSLFRHTLKEGWKDFWKTLLGPLALAAVLVAVLWPASLLVSQIPDRIPALIIYSVLLLVASGLFIHLSGAYDVKQIINSLICRLRNKLKKNTPA